MDAHKYSTENWWTLKHKTQDPIDANLIHIDPPTSQDVHANPLPSHNAARPSINIIFPDRVEFDPSQLIMPMNDSPYFLFTTRQKEAILLIALVEYTPANHFVLNATSTQSVQNVTEQASRLTLSTKPGQFTPILVSKLSQYSRVI